MIRFLLRIYRPHQWDYNNASGLGSRACRRCDQIEARIHDDPAIHDIWRIKMHGLPGLCGWFPRRDR